MPNPPTVTTNVPVPPTTDAALLAMVQLKPDLQASDPNCMDPGIVASHTSAWVPEMSSWAVGYDDHGLATTTQVWLAPFLVATPLQNSSGTINTRLPQAVRQLLSWNRQPFAQWSTFFDTLYNDNYQPNDPQPGEPIALNLMQPLVVKEVEVRPRPDLMDETYESSAGSLGTSLRVMSRVPATDNAWDNASGTIANTKDYLSHIRVNLGAFSQSAPYAEIKSVRPVFPRVRSQYWQVSVKFARDEYVNRYGIRYAKVEVKPSIRLQAMKNAPAAVVPTDANGQPNFVDLYKIEDPPKAAPQEGSGILDLLTTGFPFREALIEYRITYPWVSLDKLLHAGPIGNPGQLNPNPQADVKPFDIPDGMFLGAVNLKPFLGHPRGRVLYNGCELRECPSPVTGKIGYEVTHEFLVNPMMEWNQVRYNGTYDPFNPVVAPKDGVSFAWRTGYIVQTRSSYTRVVNGVNTYDPLYTIKYKNENKYGAVYPYPYMNFNDSDNPNLLYYGFIGDEFAPTGEG